MAEHFLSKIRVTPQDFVDAGGQPVLERHARLRALLSERAGPEVAALFAEPLISRGNDEAPPTVSWYGDTAGEARPLASLPVMERDRAEAWLAEHLRPLRALAEEPANADLALGALSVYGRDDVLVVGGRPVIVNWGLLPDGNGANVAARPGHYAATLGKYLALSQMSGGAPEAATLTPGAVDRAVPPDRATAARIAPPVIAPVISPVISPVASVSRLAWVPLLVLLILAGLVLGWLLLPGTRLFPAATPPVVTDGATLKAAQALNQSLRERQAALESALEGAVCRADGVLLLPDGRTPEGLLAPAIWEPPEPKAHAAPDALLPNSPDRVLVPDVAGGSERITLLELIESSTVLILAANQGGVATGSGFVVGPGLIVTNQHVIAQSMSQPGQILVTGGALGAPQVARVIKSIGPLADTGGDYALLRIEDTGLAAFSVHLPAASLKLSNVIAAGYPGDVLELDVSFAALKSGDMGAVPGLTVTDGTINTEQRIAPDTHVLMHSAPLSSGNSGGPLVDMCGRVVGVNTFVRKGALQNRSFALSSADLLAFLEGTDAAPEVIGEPCAPLVLRRQAMPQDPANDPPPDPEPQD